MQLNIAQGNATVRIYANDETGPFHARLWVNTRDGQEGTATLSSRRFTTLDRAKKWAAKELDR